MLHAKREYQSVGEMSDSLTQVVDDLWKVTGTLDRHFKWFYTDYTYQETFAYTDLSRHFPVALDRFMGADSASYCFTGLPNLTEGMSGAEQKEVLDGIEAKISQWLNANAFAYVYDYIGRCRYDEVKNPPVSQARFLALRDSVVMTQAVLNMDLLDTGFKVGEVLRDFYHSDAYTTILQDTARLEHVLDHQYRGYKMLSAISFKYDLVMPGRPIDCGIGSQEGNLIRYRFSSERLIPHEYVISATSRVTNVWAFVVTLLIILLAIGSFFYRKKK